jgi:hypothetical protein
VKSTIDPKAGPAIGLAFIAAPSAVLALSKPAEVGLMYSTQKPSGDSL